MDSANTVFIPALASKETVASETGVLWRLTQYCATMSHIGFVGNAVTKRAHEPLHNVRSSDRRREILDGADFKSGRIGVMNIVIFDDFITRGTTMSHTAQAILAVNPGVRVYGVALCKTERRQFHWEQFGVNPSNDHVPERWERIWDQAGNV